MGKGIESPVFFDLAQTLDCGQAFRWRELPSEGGMSLWEGMAVELAELLVALP